ncbi:MAG: NAD(P)-binding domain-containing protein [Bacteroidetes bacterium]|nr:NAD(P)-binding domain-containing protein [Bacteroidota bacterium]
MKKIAIIGSGRMGKALAGTFFRHKIPFVWSARDLKKIEDINRTWGSDISIVPLDQIFEADILIPTFKYLDCIQWISTHREKLKGKILFDINVPFNERFDALITSEGESASEIIQRLLPSTHVVGIFKNTFWVVFDTPLAGNIRSDVYVTCDDDRLTREVIALMAVLPFRFFNGGSLKRNRIIEQMTLFSRELSLRSGNYPLVSFHLWGL